MSDQTLSGKTALVTGASSGLGVDFARELAARGAKLVLVARREDLLQQVQSEIKQKHNVDVTIVTLDLGTPNAPQALHDLLKKQNVQVDVLINNAGFGVFGQDLDISWERTNQMLQLDIVTLTHMTKLFARDMVKRGFGYIMQIASIGAYQPSPTYAAYSAAKSYVLSYGEALSYELKGTGVSCTVVSPGVTATEFLQVSGQKPTAYQRMFMMTSAEVARIGVQAMLKRRISIITGFMNWLLAMSVRFTPKPLVLLFADRAMRN
ncbi:MAG TPA: SDR family oxidoreductase [Casimicrobiaceae bacterium]|nr:SDR family oxidoreductase [Casimicrobiaceae bacterium]